MDECYFNDSNDLLDQAFSGQLKVWEYCSEAQKKTRFGPWVYDLVLHTRWVLPSLKKIREICCLWKKAPKNPEHHAGNRVYRDEIITLLCVDFSILIRVINDLIVYLDQVRHKSISWVKNNFTFTYYIFVKLLRPS